MVIFMSITSMHLNSKCLCFRMQYYNIKASDELVSFGQLFGMCDQVSFPLGECQMSLYLYITHVVTTLYL